MKFRFEHPLPVSPPQALEAYGDADMLDRILANVSTIEHHEVQHWERDGAVLHRSVLYRPVPIIEKVGPTTIEPEWLEWIEHSTLNVKTGIIKFRNVPARARIAQRLTNEGSIRFEAQNGGCLRVLTGLLKVGVPLVGRIAERIIHAQAKRLLDAEAVAAAQVLRERR